MVTMKIDLNVQGMHCGGCENAVRRALEALPSVRLATVDRGAGKAHVEASDDLDPQVLVSAVESAGYDVSIA